MKSHICIDDAMHSEFNVESATGPSHSEPYESRDSSQADWPGHSTPIAGKGYVHVTQPSPCEVCGSGERVSTSRAAEDPVQRASQGNATSAPATVSPAVTDSVPEPLVYQSKDRPPTTIGRYSDSAARALNSEFGAQRQNETRLWLLQSCRFEEGKLLDAEIAEIFRHVLEVERFLMIRDACEMLMVLLSPDQWEANLSCGLHGLGLPWEWRGIKGAVNYLRVLDAKKIAEYAIKERFALVLLSLNYEDLCEHPGKYCPEEPTVSGVLNSILSEYSDDPRVSQRPKQRRNKISAGYAKVGRWLWTLAASLGFGVLLLADDQLVKIMYVFLPPQWPFILP